MKRVLYGIQTIYIVTVIIGLLGILGTIFLFRHEISTVRSVEQVGNVPFYTMTYSGDYAFDEYLLVGSKNSDEKESFLSTHLLKGLLEETYEENYGCASFTATTPEGDRIFARNLDTKGEPMPFLVTTHASNGFKSMSMVPMFLLLPEFENFEELSYQQLLVLGAPYFPLEGMNEHGLAISICTAVGSMYPIEKDQVTISDTDLVRLVLDKAASVDEAIEVIADYNLYGIPGFPSQFLIADATGASAVIEYVYGDMKVIHNTEDYQVVTNFLLYNNEALYGYGSDRYLNIDKVLEENNGIMTEEEALKLLEANTIPGDEQWSLVFNLTDKTAYVSFYGSYEDVYEFTLD